MAPTAARVSASAPSAATSTTAATRRWRSSTTRSGARPLTPQYRIPAFAWLDGWYTASPQFADEQTDYIDNRRIEFVASRSGRISDEWTASLRCTRCASAGRTLPRRRDPLTPISTTPHLPFPVVARRYIDADDRIHPRDGLAARSMVRGGIDGAART